MTDLASKAAPNDPDLSKESSFDAVSLANQRSDRLGDAESDNTIHRPPDGTVSSLKSPCETPQFLCQSDAKNPFEQAADRENFPDFSLTMKVEEDEDEDEAIERDQPEEQENQQQQDDKENGSHVLNQARQQPDASSPEEHVLNWSIDTLAEIKPMDFSPLEEQKRTPQCARKAAEQDDDSFFENPARYAVLKTPSPLVWRETRLKPCENSSGNGLNERKTSGNTTPLHRRCVQVMSECEKALKERQQRMNRLSLKLKTPSPLPTCANAGKGDGKSILGRLNPTSKLLFDGLSPITPLSTTQGASPANGLSIDHRSAKRSRRFVSTPTIQEETSSLSLSSCTLESNQQSQQHQLGSTGDNVMTSQEGKEGEESVGQVATAKDEVNMSTISSIDLNESTVVEMHMPSMELDDSRETKDEETKEDGEEAQQEQESSSLQSLSLLCDQSISHRQDSFVASLQEASQDSDSDVEEERHAKALQQEQQQQETEKPEQEDFAFHPRKTKQRRRVGFDTVSSSRVRAPDSVTSILQEARAHGLKDPSMQWEYLRICRNAQSRAQP